MNFTASDHIQLWPGTGPNALIDILRSLVVYAKAQFGVEQPKLELPQLGADEYQGKHQDSGAQGWPRFTDFRGDPMTNYEDSMTTRSQSCSAKLCSPTIAQRIR